MLPNEEMIDRMEAEDPVFRENLKQEIRRRSKTMILNYIGWCIIYSYFTYNFDEGAETCLASDADSPKDYHQLDKAPSHGKFEEVGSVWRMAFFRLHVVSIILTGVWSSVFFLERKDFTSLLQWTTVPLGIFWLIQWILLFFSRYSMAGEICAGMYLTSEDYEKDQNIEAKYLVEMGLFIKFIWWFTFICVAILVIAMTILLCVVLKQAQDRRR